ncbi:MAG: SbcC/MukB-like Walker B domain-containing protein [Pseudomonadota bacterium]|nr:SbcC/MukB-like Walker B domain-containing protein [Pseudomonadota bacterium]
MNDKRSAKPAASLFLDDLPDPRQQQFRMRRLQVFNWGTFSGLVDVPIAERGFLFVGRSGSGKSTLLDAMSALLVPPSLVDFNAAARESERSGRDRNLASYVRGAWADQQDSDSGEIATQYLRRGSTWSALALEYRNQLGQVVSLVRLFWISGSGSATADVKRHFMICERPFDIATELDGFDLDLRRLKARLGDDVHHFDNFSGYAERFRRLLGIGSEMALKLLHKTQSAKNLGDLNQFLRGFMLDEPETFSAAERLVADFGELDAAHQSVVTARRQVQTLQPAREQHGHWMALRRSSSALEEQQQGVDGYREQQRLTLLDARLADLAVQVAAAEAEQGQHQRRVDNHEQRIAELEQQRREQGGEAIDRLEREAREQQDRIHTCERHRRTADVACKGLGWTLPADAGGFARLQGEARALQESAQQAEADTEQAMDALKNEKRDASKRFAEVRAEIDALQRNPSNIPERMQSLRTRLCDALGLAENALPFVGELMQVHADHAPWRGAIERVLHGFAQALLVDERQYAKVAAWVNQTHLGGRLVYYRVGRAEEVFDRRPAAHSLIHKLELREHAMRGWLHAELTRRFDYACVDGINQLRQVERGITREGQVKHRGERHEKDDRSAVGDRRNWMLGFDNRDKLAVFEAEARELAATIASSDSRIDALRQQRREAEVRRGHARDLGNLRWDDIDIAPLLSRQSAIAEQLQQLRAADADLQRISEALSAERTRKDQAQVVMNEAAANLLGAKREQGAAGKQREACAERVAHVSLTPLQREALGKRLPMHQALSLDTLDARFRELERALSAELGEQRDEQARLVACIEKIFSEYRRLWPEDSGDFTSTMDSADSFLARLQRLERDGLPEHEARFFELLQTQSKQDLLVLQKHMSEARKSIGQRMEEVNDSLEQVPFNRDTLLQIEVNDRALPEVREFQQQLRDVLAHHQTEDRERAEQQFAILRTLVARLSTQDPDERRWREQVLDVRQHVEFIGVEVEAQSRKQVEVYRSGAGKSGGQRQKLATTCLAAALRYQLGGDDGHLPRYAPVVLDEAFDKADNEFTALAMGIFENFGFQMVVATPLKSVMTLESFIGGACFVDITGRHDSGVLLIEYDQAQQRLALPERVRGEAVHSDDAHA